MKQTGLLIVEQETDYLAGALNLEKLMPDRNWKSYTPMVEKQHDYNFDTMSCTSFSVLSWIEYWIKYLIEKGIATKEHVEELKKLGFMDKGEFNASDRWLAIMSGTTKYGNYHQKVIDTVRHVGLIPEKDLPFSGKNWDEYHNPKVITEEMKKKALRFKELFEIFYEKATGQVNENLGDSLEYSPLLGAVPYPATHAVVLPSPNYIFDTYKPFLYERQVPVHYSFRGVVKVKPLGQNGTPEQTLPYVEITRTKSDTEQTTSILEAYNNGAKFTCKTLELGWRNNLKNISCIPTGTYKVKWNFSPRFLKYTYELQAVSGRSGIRIHSANYFYQLNGCIALGSDLLDINKDERLDVTNSKITMKAFENFMGRKEFTLKIV